VELISDLEHRREEFLTVREVLQYLGTDLLRKFGSDCHVNATLNSIKYGERVVIPDIRFPNEVKAIQQAGGIVIRLTRGVTCMTHKSECILDDYDGFDIVHHNGNETVKETMKGCLVAIQRHEKYSEDLK